ncbi:PTS sugar transporter subunit IIA [Thermococcus sp. EP1]|uniref:PTS sugar transporter subunit IIA n=1 Tax=Thermococcus sp. EP1 TaxID=1591054 RepID=UPI0006DBF83A|nr:PTS sugar transporter subunit IIA [Thermococcus sp. EP1]
MNIIKKLIENMDTNAIAVNLEAENWVEAVKIAGEILYNLGKVSQEYIEGMIKTTKRLGPYAVIAPGIALPHARPENGALDLGMSIVVLRTPIDFDSPNDPVKVIIAFSAPTKSEHLELLKEVGMLLSDTTLQKKLRHTKTSNDVIAAFREAISNYEVRK